jgi:hypothetical protein
MGSSKPMYLDYCSGWMIPHYSSRDIHRDSVRVTHGLAHCVVSRERRALGRGGTQIDHVISLRKVDIRGLSADACMSCWLVFPYKVVY